MCRVIENNRLEFCEAGKRYRMAFATYLNTFAEFPSAANFSSVRGRLLDLNTHLEKAGIEFKITLDEAVQLSKTFVEGVSVTS